MQFRVLPRTIKGKVPNAMAQLQKRTAEKVDAQQLAKHLGFYFPKSKQIAYKSQTGTVARPRPKQKCCPKQRSNQSEKQHLADN